MKRFINCTNWTAAFFILFLMVGLVVFISPTKALTLEEQLEQVKQELAAIRNKKKEVKSSIQNEKQIQNIYSGKIGELRGEVETVQLDIAELNLQIKELELSITQLEEQIALKEEEMTANQAKLDEFKEAVDAGINKAYKEHRIYRENRLDIFNVKSPNNYFIDSKYQELIYAKMSRVVEELADLRSQLRRDKEELEEKQVVIRRDRAVVADQHAQLKKIQSEFKSKIDAYSSAIYTSKSKINSAVGSLEVYSDAEAKKMARMENIRQALFNSFVPAGNGRYVERGRQIGNQGSTGWSTGPHLHFMVKNNGYYRNPCDFLSSAVSSKSEGSCGWGSGLSWPLQGGFYYTSRYYSGAKGDARCFLWSGKWSCSSHLGIDIAHPVWNAPVYAAHSGWLYKSVDQYGALYIILCEKKSCSGGLMTGYWHLSRY